jgi:uncharacterized lipoprotein YmbA
MTLRVNTDIVPTQTQDGGVLLNRKSGRYYQLNEGAFAVFEEVQAGRDVDEHISALQQTHPQHNDRVAKDVRAIVQNFIDAGIVISHE